MAQILVVEDEAIVALDIRKTLQTLGYAVSAIATSGEEAIGKAEEFRPDLVLMDIRLRGNMDGITAAEEIHRRFDIPVIYLTAHADEQTFTRAKGTDPFSYLLKPFKEKDLSIAIDMALGRHDLEKRAKESKRWLDALLQGMGDGVIATGEDGRVKVINPVAEGLTGWSREKAMGMDLSEVFNTLSEKTCPPGESAVARALREGAAVRMPNHILIARDGTETPVDCSVAPIRDERGAIAGAILNFRDVTERREAREELEISLKEIHHRVKNNLQIVSSLLNLQSGFVEDQKTRSMFIESRDRVRAMALFHEKLYQSSGLANIDFGEYVQSLTTDLFDTYQVSTQRVALEARVEVNSLDLDLAIPCGLIICELVSNCLKHAFPEGRTGKVEIGLRRNGEGGLTLSVSDNGVGFPQGLDFRNTESLGLQLVNSLAVQLDGAIELHRNGGTEFRITFAGSEEDPGKRN